MRWISEISQGGILIACTSICEYTHKCFSVLVHIVASFIRIQILVGYIKAVDKIKLMLEALNPFQQQARKILKFMAQCI